MSIDRRSDHIHRTARHRSPARRIAAAGVIAALAIFAGRPASAALVLCGDATIVAGGAGRIGVWLKSEGVDIAGVQNDLTLAAGLDVGGQRCTPNPAIDKNGTAFAPLPGSCEPGGCGRVRAIVLALQNVDPIPEGALLYTCEVVVGTDVRAGAYPVRVVNAGAATPEGAEVRTRGVDCVVQVTTAGAPALGPQAPAAPPEVQVHPSAASRPAATRGVAAPSPRVAWPPTPTATPRAGQATRDRVLTDEAVASAGGGCELDRGHDGGRVAALPTLVGLLALTRARRRRCLLRPPRSRTGTAGRGAPRCSAN